MFPELSSLVLSGEKRNCSSASFNNFIFAFKDLHILSIVIIILIIIVIIIIVIIVINIFIVYAWFGSSSNV